ncbi:MAG TPA: hypothetical protein VGQ23_01685 [Burkholderiaceae bacterium]|jgi:hypothetical protein|nr:hypothetical protein [Burkholderiaceae bacterium]
MECVGCGVVGAEEPGRGADSSPAVWLHLLALLHHAREECTGLHSAHALRSLGRSKVTGARRVLQRESEQVLAALHRRAVVIDRLDVVRAAQALQLCDDLAEDFLALVRAYEEAAELAQRCGDAALARWLDQHARLHSEHHGLLR